MISQLKIGSRVEREHVGTYKSLKNFVAKNKRLPSVSFFTRHIARDHLREDPMYYTKLRRAKL